MRGIFVHGKSGAFRRKLEENAARFREIDGLEPETIDDRSRTRTAVVDAIAHCELMRFIVHPPGQVMNAAGSPRSTASHWHLANIDVIARFSVANSVTMPAALGPKVREIHGTREKRGRSNQVALHQPRTFQTANLLLDGDRASFPRRERPPQRFFALHQRDMETMRIPEGKRLLSEAGLHIGHPGS